MRKIIAIVTLLFTVSMFAADGKTLASSLGLSAASKASTQWKRVFKKKRKMQKYGIDKLSAADRDVLKAYLIDHAADSDSPEVAGM